MYLLPFVSQEHPLKAVPDPHQPKSQGAKESKSQREGRDQNGGMPPHHRHVVSA